MKKSTDRPGSTFGFATVVEQYLDHQATAQTDINGGLLRPSPTEIIKSYPPPQEELDLHGMTAEEGEKAVRRFIEDCLSLRLATLRIITGKGLHSRGQPVLPSVTEAVLEELKQGGAILAHRWARKRQGRESGALIVYLPRGQR
ncbi:MAG: Smr/MutS family protein [Desulfurivibrio sp.]